MNYLILIIVFVGLYLLYIRRRPNQTIKNIIQNELLIREYIAQNFDSYNEEYNIVQDTLNEWVKMKYKQAHDLIFHNWQLDTLLFVNSSKDKLFGSILISTEKAKASTQEAIKRVNGLKVNGEWRIIIGSKKILLKGVYQRSKVSPLGFERMSIINHMGFGKSYFERRDGKVLNQNIFKNMTLATAIYGSETVRSDDFAWKHYKKSLYNYYVPDEEIERIEKELSKTKYTEQLQEERDGAQYLEYEKIFSALGVLEADD